MDNQQQNNQSNSDNEKLFDELDSSKKGNIKDFIFELIKVIIISAAIVLPVRYFLIQPFLVKGASMEPTFFEKDYLIINEITYRIGEPDRGDVVVLKYPNDPSQYFLKRIIGLPNETVEIRDGKVFIHNELNPEGIELDEHYYLSEDVSTFGLKEVMLKDDEYFVMGDNRSFSLDSRTFGSVDEEFIVGRAWVRGWPFSRFGVIDQVEYDINGNDK